MMNNCPLVHLKLVLEYGNDKGKIFYKIMRDIVEIMYRRTFRLQYINQFDDSKNQVITKLHVVFLEQWLVRLVGLVIEKTYNNKK